MKEIIKKKPLLSFYILAYIFSWVVWVPLIFIGEIDKELTQLIMLIGVFGPMVAAIVVSRIIGSIRHFWKVTLKWKVSIIWYIAALGIPLVVLLAIRLIAHFFGVMEEGVMVETIEGGPWYMYPLVLLFMVFLGGGMEEPGWRGFAQERMLAKFTPFLASIILGVIWTYWHLPLYLVPGSSQQGMESQIIWYTFSVTGLAVILTWLFIKSKGSALLAILFHGGINAINSWVPAFYVSILGIKFNSFAIMSFLNVLVAIIIIITNLKLFFRKLDKTEYLSDKLLQK